MNHTAQSPSGTDRQIDSSYNDIREPVNGTMSSPIRNVSSQPAEYRTEATSLPSDDKAEFDTSSTSFNERVYPSPFAKLEKVLDVFGGGGPVINTESCSFRLAKYSSKQPKAQGALTPFPRSKLAASRGGRIFFARNIRRDRLTRAIIAYDEGQKIEAQNRTAHKDKMKNVRRVKRIFPLSTKSKVIPPPILGVTGVNLEEFHKYPELPIELRLIIMKLNWPGPRHMKVEPMSYKRVNIRELKCSFTNPFNLYICGETRVEMLRHYQPISKAFGIFPYTGHPIYFNSAVDTLEFPSQWMENHIAQCPTFLELPFNYLLGGVKALSMDISKWGNPEVTYLLTLSLEIFTNLHRLELSFYAGMFPNISETWVEFCAHVQDTYGKSWAIDSLSEIKSERAVKRRRKAGAAVRCLPITAFKRAPLESGVESIDKLDVTPEEVMASVPWGGIPVDFIQTRLGSNVFSKKVSKDLNDLIADELRWRRIPATYVIPGANLYPGAIVMAWEGGGSVVLIRDEKFEKTIKGAEEENMPGLVVDNMED